MTDTTSHRPRRPPSTGRRPPAPRGQRPPHRGQRPAPSRGHRPVAGSVAHRRRRAPHRAAARRLGATAARLLSWCSPSCSRCSVPGWSSCRAWTRPAYAAEATRLTHRHPARDPRARSPTATARRWPPRWRRVDVTADQTLVTDPAAEAAALAPVLGMRRRHGRCAADRHEPVRLRRQAGQPATWPRSRRSTTRPCRLPGIYSQKTSKRVYPAGPLAANVLGFVGVDPTANGISYVGRGGLELDAAGPARRPRRQPDLRVSAGGRAIPTGQRSERRRGARHRRQLTIDRDIQWFTQQALADGRSRPPAPRRATRSSWTRAPARCWRWPPRRRSTPTTRARPRRRGRGNHALSVAYEPGSTGKLITAAALLEEGVVKPGHPVHGAQPARAGGQELQGLRGPQRAPSS